jgi:predicted PurR-regulated permease PerM
MIEGLMYLSPLDDAYERELLEKFAEISRTVVVAMLLSAVVQGALAGIGYYLALDVGAPIFLLTALTMLLSIVPFVGAAGVWVPTCLWLALTPDSNDPSTTHWKAALFLALYGALVVSMVDNLIKPWVLHGQSKLHPLLALLSILGGIQVLGPIGILIGPMLVTFLQALLKMVRKELDQFHLEAEQTATEVSAEPDPLVLQPAPASTQTKRSKETTKRRMK